MHGMSGIKCGVQLTRFVYSTVIAVNAHWFTMPQFLKAHMSICSSSLFSQQVCGPAPRTHFSPLHSAFGCCDHSLTNCSLLTASSHFTLHYSWLTVSGPVCWGSWLTSYILEASQSRSCCFDVSRSFDSFSNHRKRWRVSSWLLWHRRPDRTSRPRPVQMRHCYSVLLVVKDRGLVGCDAVWCGRW